MRGITLTYRLEHFTDNVSYLFVFLFFEKRITYKERRNVSMIIANLLPCQESNTVVVDPAKLHGRETTGNILFCNSDLGVVDPASTQCCETTV